MHYYSCMFFIFQSAQVEPNKICLGVRPTKVLCLCWSKKNCSVFLFGKQLLIKTYFVFYFNNMFLRNAIAIKYFIARINTYTLSHKNEDKFFEHAYYRLVPWNAPYVLLSCYTSQPPTCKLNIWPDLTFTQISMHLHRYIT